LFAHAIHFIKNLARTNLCHPVFHVTLTFTLTHFQGFLSNWFIREHTNPDFSTTFYVTSHRTTSCFDLTRSNATATSCFQAKITKTNFGATLGQAAVAALHLLAKLCTLWL